MKLHGVKLKGIGVQGLGFRVLRCRAWGLGFRGSGFLGYASPYSSIVVSCTTVQGTSVTNSSNAAARSMMEASKHVVQVSILFKSWQRAEDRSSYNRVQGLRGLMVINIAGFAPEYVPSAAPPDHRAGAH